MKVRSDQLIAEGIGGVQRVTARDAAILRCAHGAGTLGNALTIIEAIAASKISHQPPPGFERRTFSSKLKLVSA